MEKPSKADLSKLGLSLLQPDRSAYEQIRAEVIQRCGYERFRRLQHACFVLSAKGEKEQRERYWDDQARFHTRDMDGRCHLCGAEVESCSHE